MKALLLTTALLFATIPLIIASQDTCINGNENGECQVSSDDDALTQQAVAFGDFLVKIFDINDAYMGTNRTEQEYLVLKSVFESVDMDASLLTSPTLSYNWYFDFYNRLTAMAPPNYFFRVYEGRPTDLEVQVVAAMDPSAVQQQAAEEKLPGMSLKDQLRKEAFRRYRFRGGQTRGAQVFRMVVENPLKYWIGFAVPSDDVLQKIAQYSPLVEVGAGTGYWSAALQLLPDVDIVAYDSEPPSDDDSSNVYFHKTFSSVLPGTCTSVFTQHPDYGNGKRTLLMVWPNNPDNVDQPNEFGSDNLPPTWDVDCLKAFYKVGGITVIFVGERMERIPKLPNAPQESGLTATRKFQTLLKRYFHLVDQMDIPKWWTVDDVTIWKRKERVDT